jgi:hypothetical protein
MEMDDQYALTTAEKVLSIHSNREGAKLSALFHVQNGESISWEDRRLPLDVASDIGMVNGQDRFVVYRYLMTTAQYPHRPRRRMEMKPTTIKSTRGDVLWTGDYETREQAIAAYRDDLGAEAHDYDAVDPDWTDELEVLFQ